MLNLINAKKYRPKITDLYSKDSIHKIIAGDDLEQIMTLAKVKELVDVLAVRAANEQSYRLNIGDNVSDKQLRELIESLIADFGEEVKVSWLSQAAGYGGLMAQRQKPTRQLFLLNYTYYGSELLLTLKLKDLQ